MKQRSPAAGSTQRRTVFTVSRINLQSQTMTWTRWFLTQSLETPNNVFLCFNIKVSFLDLPASQNSELKNEKERMEHLLLWEEIFPIVFNKNHFLSWSLCWSTWFWSRVQTVVDCLHWSETSHDHHHDPAHPAPLMMIQFSSLLLLILLHLLFLLLHLLHLLQLVLNKQSQVTSKQLSCESWIHWQSVLATWQI